MSCSAKFTNDISLSCVFSLIAEYRNGPTTQTIKNTLWLIGCVIEKTGVPVLPLPQEEVSTMSEVTIESLLNQLETEANNLAQPQVSVMAGSPPVAGVQGWEVLIPILLQLFNMWLQNRKKKQEPAPAPTAPVTRPATAESIVESPKKK